MLLEAHHEAASMQNNDGMLPHHIALRNHADPDTIMILFEAFHEAVSIKDNEKNNSEELPLRTSVQSNAAQDLINTIYEAYSDSIMVKDCYGFLLLHFVLRSQ